MTQTATNPNLSLEAAFDRLTAGEFGFIDAGASQGGSLEFCEKRFERGKGLGVDIAAYKVQRTLHAGYEALHADLLTTPFPEDCVSFSSMMDFLEHLPDEDSAQAAIKNLARASRDFLFIRHPSFDFTEYLKNYALKFDWTDWKGHTNMMKIDAFPRICGALGLEKPLVLSRHEVLDSSDPAIVPLSAPRDTVRYNADTLDVKPQITFSKPVYKQYDIFIKLNPIMSSTEWQSIVEATHDQFSLPHEHGSRKSKGSVGLLKRFLQKLTHKHR